jgi:hypothetical protein
MHFWKLHLLTLAAGELVRDTTVEGAPGFCSTPTKVMCVDMAREMLSFLRDAVYMLEFDTELDEAPSLFAGADGSVLDCLLARADHLRTSVQISDCAFNELIKLNRESTRRIQFADFERIANDCAVASFSNSPCQLHTWYSLVISPHAGKSLESLRTDSSELKVAGKVWTVAPSFVLQIIDTQIERLVPADETTRVKRGLPRTSAEPSSKHARIGDPQVNSPYDSDDDWIDSIADILGDVPAESISPEELIMPEGLIESPPGRCKARRFINCSAQYKQGLEYLLAGLDDDSLLGVVELLDRLGLRSRDELCSCARHHLSKFRKSLLACGPAFRAMLLLNRDNVPVTHAELRESLGNPRGASVCNSHKWFYFVINPFAGQSVGSLDLVKTDESCYTPPANIIKQLIDYELERLGAAVNIGMTQAASEGLDLTLRIKPKGIISGLGECGRVRKVTCAAEYIRALHVLRDGVAGGVILPVFDILGRLGMRVFHDQYDCVLSELTGFRKSLYVKQQSLADFITLNQHNAPISPEDYRDNRRRIAGKRGPWCPHMKWMYIVVNPMAGRTVGDLKLVISQDAAGDQLFSPSRARIEELVDLEISRLRSGD